MERKENVELYFFSPTGGTKTVAEHFCAGFAKEVIAIELTGHEVIQPVGDVIVVAVPVFGGRIPPIVPEMLQKINGNGKCAVTLVVYGNRAYEDALLELNHIMQECGFSILASAALLAQHSIVPEVGAGRPNEQDVAEITAFAEKVLEKSVGGTQGNQVNVPGNYPYKESKGSSASPITMESCKCCGACVSACPAGAISIADGQVVTDAEKCILCMACVAKCHSKARILPQELQAAMAQKLAPFKDICKKNEFYL